MLKTNKNIYCLFFRTCDIETFLAQIKNLKQEMTL